MAVGDHSSEDEEASYPGKLSGYVTIACIIAAMGGGLMFGYELTGILGGVTSIDSFLKRFLLPEPKDGEFLTLSNLYLCSIISSIVFAAMFTRGIGRKCSILIGSSIMVFGSLMFLLGALLCGFANQHGDGEVMTVLLGLMACGYGIGLLNQSVPLYLSEMAPYKYRGAFNIGFQLFINIGILAANVLNYYFFAKIPGGWGWSLSLGVVMVPALMVIVGSCFLPDTPNSMIDRGYQNEARETLIKIRGVQNVDEEFNGLIAAGEISRTVPYEQINLFQRKYRPYLTMVIAIPLFQHFTGINVIMFYLPLLFRTIGFGNNASSVFAILTGIVNVVATIVSIYGADKWGRRKLFFGGGIQMFIAQIGVAICIALKPCVTANHCNISEWYTILVVLFICLYVSGFASSWGPLGWLVPSEIFPLEIRCHAQSINVSMNLLFTYITTIVLLKTHWHLTFWLFIFFGFLVVVITLFIYFFLPETKNIPIEEMSIVWKQHWYWSQFVADFDYPDGDLETSLGALLPEQV